MLKGELAVAEAPAPRLMPNLADIYRGWVAALQEALAGDEADHIGPDHEAASGALASPFDVVAGARNQLYLLTRG